MYLHLCAVAAALDPVGVPSLLLQLIRKQVLGLGGRELFAVSDQKEQEADCRQLHHGGTVKFTSTPLSSWSGSMCVTVAVLWGWESRSECIAVQDWTWGSCRPHQSCRLYAACFQCTGWITNVQKAEPCKTRLTGLGVDSFFTLMYNCLLESIPN